MNRTVEALKIIATSILAAIVYGIAHDQITARVCVEYFTIGHPRIFPTESPTLLAIGWGALATWWVGLLLGLGLAFASLRGQRPARTARTLVRPIAILLAVMAVAALLAGAVGYFAATQGWVFLVGWAADNVPRDRHDVFIADLWAHSASYLAGFVGGIVLMFRVWRARQRAVRTPA
ncbi:MAG: hypothetical protein NXI31_14410 [bacterium]|nr:hypothetical protein [bacterium]